MSYLLFKNLNSEFSFFIFYFLVLGDAVIVADQNPFLFCHLMYSERCLLQV